MVLFLLNSIITPFKDQRAVFEIRRIDVNEAKKIVHAHGQFTSAIGHSASADILSLLLGIPVTVNRIQVFFQPNDEAIAIVLKQRLSEGAVIRSIEEIEKIGFELYYLRRVQ